MRIKKRTNDWLKKSFTIYNKKFFNNVIPDQVVVKYGDPDEANDAHYDPDDRVIVVSKLYRDHDTTALICLLHEMAHAKLCHEGYVGGTTSKDPLHGPRFQAEIIRLFNIGAYDGLL